MPFISIQLFILSLSDGSSCQLPAEMKNWTSDENLEQTQIDGGGRLKSSLKKKKKEKVPQVVKESRGKKMKVQWMDFSGKELVEIKEFDSIEARELDFQGDRSNACIIL
ncbi:hypothetical protein SAY87_028570 [Trapa incisa]|uniref:Uncharacterized protein n=2 Tax=Trapa TaxID=22665 RepID=A0AAN7M0K0_TRANT|nr:hypothetical protein SAY87_028570 [Trapa incisa]KAK4789577.1 hypothetical protein SAY86_016881 [Trapa natans]